MIDNVTLPCYLTINQSENFCKPITNPVTPLPHLALKIASLRDFLGGPLAKNLPASTGNMGLIPGLGRFHMLWGN